MRIFAECYDDSDEEHCRPHTHRAPPNAEIEAMVEDLCVTIKRWVYLFP
ncbi:hypothetical protein PVAP13_8NG216301 [Panicum virgatum]|uniref:Uncharacterized protein n=1 Tax=Panicum virgatum TaxID=38727 RepID=A0A8T0P5T6_PANVG|nr:hypothetical protein PVAP13_8NG216301 [Panicum virgatum]